jgi:hypothetical protein
MKSISSEECENNEDDNDDVMSAADIQPVNGNTSANLHLGGNEQESDDANEDNRHEVII